MWRSHPSTDSFVKKKKEKLSFLLQNDSFKINYDHSSGLPPPSNDKISRYHLFPPTIPQLLVTLDSIPPTNRIEISAR